MSLNLEISSGVLRENMRCQTPNHVGRKQRKYVICAIYPAPDYFFKYEMNKHHKFFSLSGVQSRTGNAVAIFFSVLQQLGPFDRESDPKSGVGCNSFIYRGHLSQKLGYSLDSHLIYDWVTKDTTVHPVPEHCQGLWSVFGTRLFFKSTFRLPNIELRVGHAQMIQT